MGTDQITYNLDLPVSMAEIESSDLFLMTNLMQPTIPKTTIPIKFKESVNIFVKQGTAKIDINLMSYEITAPCLVNVHRNQILQIKSCSDDICASCIIMSKRFTDNLFLRMKDNPMYVQTLRIPVVPIPRELLFYFESQERLLQYIINDKDSPYQYQAEVLAISSFYYHTGYKLFKPYVEEITHTGSRIPDKFLSLVQQHFKKERFLQFYADELEITPKHLSRTMKSLTGFSAVEWIERYVVLEAKVQLKSTNKSIQQISDELNFPSQSFFGKYFKKCVKMSPKEFRNS